MKILISNDDGVWAEGIKVLHKELQKLGEAVVVAPLEEKSTTGHALTLHKPLRLRQFDEWTYGINGGPADCVQMGVGEVLGSRPDLFVSGINRGANLGQDIFYSGTVAAAREAAIMGIPSIAVSSCIEGLRVLPDQEIYYQTAARVVSELIPKIDFKFFSRGTVLNVNVPNLPFEKVKGLKITKQGFRKYSFELDKRVDHRAQNYYWVGGSYEGFDPIEGSDAMVVEEGWAALTPLHIDCTNYVLLKDLESIF